MCGRKTIFHNQSQRSLELGRPSPRKTGAPRGKINGNVFDALVKMNGFDTMQDYQKSQSEFKHKMESEDKTRQNDQHQIDLMAQAIKKAMSDMKGSI